MKSRAFSRALLISAFAGALSLPAFAEDDHEECCSTPQEKQQLLRLDVAARIDWQLDRHGSHTDDANTGFVGKYLMLRADGEFLPGLTYSWRQRLNKMHSDTNFFDATDWLYVNYAVKGWQFEAGKEIVAIGGWEYDRYPLDLFATSVFWNNIPCYQLGATVGYNISPSDNLSFQACQSPFFTRDNRNMYGYSLRWSANHSIFHPIWSVNLFEYDKGKYINYISLGNRFDFGKWRLEADVMNRAASHQGFLFKDCTVVGDLSFMPTDRWRIHAKYTYDVNHSGTSADCIVLDGTEISMAGAGVEFYPLRKERTSLRVHAAAFYSWGRNANAADLMQSKTLFANVGLTWNMNLLNIKR